MMTSGFSAILHEINDKGKVTHLNQTKLKENLKKFKEKCRVLRIPPLLRGYLSQNQHLMSLFEKHKPLS